MFLIARNIEFNKQLSKYLYKELRDNGIDVVKDGVLINVYLKNKNLLIDCLAGKVYIKNGKRDKYFCDLGFFKDKTHLGEAYNCAVFNCKKLIKKIENLDKDELVKESEVQVVDLRNKPKDLRGKLHKLLLCIDNKIYEFKMKKESLDQKITNNIKQKEINNKDIKVFGSAYKDEKNKNIYINDDTYKNLTYDKFYILLKTQYPKFNIYGNFKASSNRIKNRIASKNYPDSAYDWVEERAELLMDKENMGSDMAYGIAWIQYKQEFGEN